MNKEKLLKYIKDGKITDETTLAVFQMNEELLKEIETLREEVKTAIKEVKDSEMTLPKLLEGIKGKKGDTGDKGVKGDKGDKGQDGINGNDYILTEQDKKQIASSIKVPVVEKVIEKTEVIKEQPVVEIKEVAVLDPNVLPQYGEKFRDGLETLTGDDRLDKSAIKGLDEELKKLSTPKQQNMASIVGRDVIKVVDISDQLDGSTKTFNLPATYTVLTVDLSSFPYGSCRKNIDYTWTPTTITFTDQIDAPTQLASGTSCLITIVTT